MTSNPNFAFSMNATVKVLSYFVILGDGTYAAVHIFDVLPSTKTEGLSEKDYIPSVHILQAMWTVGNNFTVSSLYGKALLIHEV